MNVNVISVDVIKAGEKHINQLSQIMQQNKNSKYRYCILLGTDHLTCRGVMVFCFVQNFFSDNTRVRISIFFVAQSAIFPPRIQHYII